MTDQRAAQMSEVPLWRPQSFLLQHPLAQAGHYAEALNVYDNLIARDPVDILVYLLRGRALGKLQRPEEAQASYLHALYLAEQRISEHPNDGRSYVYRADALAILKRREEALLAYDQAIQMAPGDYEAYLNKGWEQLVLGHNHEALTLFQRAHDLRPDDADILWRMNVAYWHTGQFEKSLEALEQAIALDPTQARFYGDLATTLDALGRDEEVAAAEAREKALAAQELQEAEARYRQMIQHD